MLRKSFHNFKQFCLDFIGIEGFKSRFSCRANINWVDLKRLVEYPLILETNQIDHVRIRRWHSGNERVDSERGNVPGDDRHFSIICHHRGRTAAFIVAVPRRDDPALLSAPRLDLTAHCRRIGFLAGPGTGDQAADSTGEDLPPHHGSLSKTCYGADDLEGRIVCGSINEKITFLQDLDQSLNCTARCLSTQTPAMSITFSLGIHQSDSLRYCLHLVSSHLAPIKVISDKILGKNELG